MKKTTIKIRGMHCTSCEMLLTDVLQEIPGVSTVAVSFKNGNATVTFDEKKTTENACKDAIKKEGYKV
jgi:Cu+-exporting ATPase